MEKNKKSSDNQEQVSSVMGQFCGEAMRRIRVPINIVVELIQNFFESTIEQQPKTTSRSRRSTQVTTTEKYESAVYESPRISYPETLPSLNPKTLILVVYADQEMDVIQESNRSLNQWIYEKFYEVTQYLCIVEDSFFKSKENQVKNFIVPEGQERDDDIYLIKLHLRDNDERFNPRVNQIDRIRAFRELSSLVDVDDSKILPRLRLEAGQLFNLYHR